MGLNISLDIFFVSLFSFLITYYITPLLIEGALKMGIVDKPDGILKKHKKPVPYLGGFAIYLGVLFSISILSKYNNFIIIYLFGATMIISIGLIDDLKVLKPSIKFLFQLLAVIVVIKSGIKISVVFLPDILNVLLSVLWLLIAINAYNFIDISDGVLGGTAFINTIFFMVFAGVLGEKNELQLLTVVCGAVLAFLLYNYPPAKIFAGDTGSMFVGFTIGFIAMLLDYSKINKISVLIPLFVMFYPLLDFSYTFLRRLYFKILPWIGSPHHYTITVKEMIKNEKIALYYIYFFSIAGGVSGIITFIYDIKGFIVSSIFLFVLSFLPPIVYWVIRRKRRLS